ncbi:MAG TPA: sigma 54-interacting transcriptional regulator, partial [Methylomirabilota bacterium]|nr:sigma 54-interacting transcriptional regulator [Methylomirabilota bacterium]
MDPLAELIGESPGMVALRGQVTRLLRHHARSHRLPPVLLQGETGTGKGVLASALHRASPRAESSFVAVNCAAIPETLLEAEMFGFERGAFTDARQAKPGLFQAAHRGTIFLDEIGLLPEGLQAKLLKAIEEREVRRLGSTRSESVDVWILTAASEDLARARHARHFHEALYHRLSVLTFCLPPLRERGDDVLLLARHFLDRVCREYGMPPTTFAPGVEAALRAHPWPGNVRELGNAIERAALLSGGGPVTVETLGLEPAPAGGHGRATRGAAVNLGEAVDTVEREHILAALTETRWNVSHAAARLGIPRTSLVYRIQKHGLSPPKAARRHRRVLPRPEHPERTTVAFTAPDMRWERRQLALLRVAGGTAGGAPASAAVAALEALLGKVQSFGGRLEEIGPSGLMATFGLEPIEDAPVRAAHAAMAMQKAAERARRAAVPAFRLTVAIHCGPVMTAQVQGGWQIALEDKRAAVGLLDALVEQAAPDTIVVSPAAARLLARRFQLEPVTAAGGGSDEPAYRLAGLESTGLGLGGRALSRFVGRDRELTALHDLLRRVERGAGQAVGLMGEPGVGKSRVLYEFRQSLTGAGLAYLEGHCLSYRSTTPYGPLLDVLRQACGVTEDDLPPVVSQTLRARLEGLGLDPDVDAPYLLHALGFTEGTEGLAPLSPETIKIGTFEALRRLVLRQGRGRPAVLVIEDLHWIDRTSEEVLAALVDRLAGVPVLVVASYRPGYRPSWMDRSYVTQLTLPELSPEDSRAIVESALGAAAGPLVLTEAIVKRAEGNPFFLEELAWAIAERASAHEPASIPETVQGALLGRIDRLPQARRRLL